MGKPASKVCVNCGGDKTGSGYKTVCSKACADKVYGGPRKPNTHVWDTEKPDVKLRTSFLTKPWRSAA